MSDKKNLEIVDTIDRRKNKRYYPAHMMITVNNDKYAKSILVDDVSVEGIRFFLNDFVPFKETDLLTLRVPGIDKEIKAFITHIDEQTMRVQFKANAKLKELLETNFDKNVLYA